MVQVVVDLRPIVFFSIQEWEDELHVVLEEITVEFGPIVRTPLNAEEPIDVLFLIYQVTDHEPMQLTDALDQHLGKYSPPGPRVCIYACGRAAAGQTVNDEDVRRLAVDTATGRVSTALSARVIRPANFGDLARQEIHRVIRHRSHGMLPSSAVGSFDVADDAVQPDWESM